MIGTKAVIASIYVFGMASGFLGWLTSTSPAVITGLIASLSAGVIAAIFSWQKNQIEISRLEAIASAEEREIHTRSCEDRFRALESKYDKQYEEIINLRVRVMQWETKYPQTTTFPPTDGVIP